MDSLAVWKLIYVIKCIFDSFFYFFIYITVFPETQLKVKEDGYHIFTFLSHFWQVATKKWDNTEELMNHKKSKRET